MAFDRDKACELVSHTLRLISSRYPTSALEWLEQNRPDMLKPIKAAEVDIDAAILGDKHLSFPLALGAFVNGNMAAFDLYSKRVVTQPALFPRAPSPARAAQ